MRELLRKIASVEKPQQTRDETLALFRRIRARTLELAAPLTAEDQCIQSMPDVSPTKWHLAHTSWAFETFVLKPFDPSYGEFHPDYNFLFNSYYESVGPRHQRPRRGLLSRPPLEDVQAYRRHVENAAEVLIGGASGQAWDEIRPFVDLANNHEQQHQELMLTDIKHVFSCNPMRPAYRPQKSDALGAGADKPATGNGRGSWIEFPEGLVETGHDFSASPNFAYDNEGPRHKVWLNGFRLASRPVTNAQYLEFIADEGYRRPEFWLSDGWAACQTNAWQAPFYWQRDGGREGDAACWQLMTLSGMRGLDPAEPVCHVSFFEADAYAKWAGKRLPLEAEWERMAGECPVEGNFADSGHFHPVPANGGTEHPAVQVFGDVWEWTRSAYVPYPGYRAAPGAVGEYNGKFMSSQMVLRGGSAATPEGHVRATYRNFFYPPDRWQFSGIRLAEDT